MEIPNLCALFSLVLPRLPFVFPTFPRFPIVFHCSRCSRPSIAYAVVQEPGGAQIEPGGAQNQDPAELKQTPAELRP